MAIELNIDDTEVTNLLEKSINQYIEDRFKDDLFINKLSSLVSQAVNSRLERLELTETVDKVVTAKLCLLYTSDAADDMQCVDLGGRRIIKKMK